MGLAWAPNLLRMTELRSYRTPFAALRDPPRVPRARRGRLEALVHVLKAGGIITAACTVSAGSCGLVAGGWQGVVVAAGLFSAMGLLGMAIAAGVAVLVDSTRAVQATLTGPVVRSEVLERGAGQLSVSGLDGALAELPRDKGSDF